MRHRKLTYEELLARSHDADSLRNAARTPVSFVLENIRSLYNVGSVFRTADALRLERLYLTGFTGRPPRKEIDKAALGAAETVPWTYETSTIPVIERLKEDGVQVVAVEQTADSGDYFSFEFSFPVAMVFGNEFDGMAQETLSACGACVEIPMLGAKQSLNVATAAGILGYELYRRISRARE